MFFEEKAWRPHTIKWYEFVAFCFHSVFFFLLIKQNLISDSFTEIDANVTCRHLGFLKGNFTYHSFARNLTDYILWEKPDCKGSENSLFDCPGANSMKTGRHICGAYSFVVFFIVNSNCSKTSNNFFLFWTVGPHALLHYDDDFICDYLVVAHCYSFPYIPELYMKR